jgi:hypothetical protein
MSGCKCSTLTGSPWRPWGSRYAATMHFTDTGCSCSSVRRIGVSSNSFHCLVRHLARRDVSLARIRCCPSGLLTAPLLNIGKPRAGKSKLAKGFLCQPRGPISALLAQWLRRPAVASHGYLMDQPECTSSAFWWQPSMHRVGDPTRHVANQIHPGPSAVYRDPTRSPDTSGTTQKLWCGNFSGMHSARHTTGIA